MWVRNTLLFLLGFAFCLCAETQAHAQRLTTNFEVKLVPNVGSAWQTVDLDNTYTSPVVVCTYALPSIASNDATVRVRNAGATSFQVRVQQFETSNSVTAANVHCIIADEGAYNSGGLKYEARTVLSDRTSGQYVPSGWDLVNLEEVTGSLTQSYSSPVVLGQVMTFNDSQASVFWTNNCTSRGGNPFQSNNRICVGKHIGMINDSRANETIGYIVAETTTATVNDIKFRLALGPDSVAGTANAAPYNYALGDHYDIGVASQNGEDGGNGGWAVLYGANPLAGNNIGLAIEEETFAGDTTRRHTTENVSYWVFQNNQTADIQASKDINMSSESASPYAIPGSDVIYTFNVENVGSAKVDDGTIFIVDEIPDNTTFYYGDMNGPGPGTSVTVFNDVDSGLSYNEATDLKFSNSATRPMDFDTDCTYGPTSGYDPNITFVCIRPSGEMNDGSLVSSGFQVSFRVQVN